MVAANAEKSGRRAAGIVLLDPLDRSQVASRLFLDLQSTGLKQASLLRGVSDATLTANFWYHQLCSTKMADEFHGVRPKAPTLHVRASEKLKHMKQAKSRYMWNMSGTPIYVPGDHISMLHNQETANAVDHWLSSLATETSTAQTQRRSFR
jgi:hypothetical protein